MFYFEPPRSAHPDQGHRPGLGLLGRQLEPKPHRRRIRGQGPGSRRARRPPSARRSARPGGARGRRQWRGSRSARSRDGRDGVAHGRTSSRPRCCEAPGGRSLVQRATMMADRQTGLVLWRPPNRAHLGSASRMIAPALRASHGPRVLRDVCRLRGCAAGTHRSRPAPLGAWVPAPSSCPRMPSQRPQTPLCRPAPARGMA